MDDEYKPRALAAWYMPSAVASLLFMAFGCVIYLMHVLADPAAGMYQAASARGLYSSSIVPSVQLIAPERAPEAV